MTSRPPSYNQNNNQNYFVTDEKTSSRVLQAPGGASSITLSWEGTKNGMCMKNNYLKRSANLLSNVSRVSTTLR